MSRVWKQFLKNLAWPVGITAYILGSLTAGAYVALLLGFDPEAGVMASGLVMIAFPTLAYMVLGMWRDAKEKVERENREMMNTLKGDDRSSLYEN